MAHLAFLKLVPREVWYVLVAAILYRGAIAWYEDKLADAYKAGETAAYQSVEGKARFIEHQVLMLTNRIRETFDAKRSRIDAAAADELRLGPGKAAYRCPATPAASRPEPGPGAPVPPRVNLPPVNWGSDLAVVSWGWLVSHAQTCDLNLTEVKAWRSQHDGLVKAYQSQLPPGSSQGAASAPAERR